MKKKLVIAIIIIVSTFAVFNVFWYYTTNKLYGPFKDGMEKIGVFTYCSHDAEDFGYIVSLPSYLHFSTGCLSITNAKDETSLIIWPKYNGKHFKYGIIVPYMNEKYQVYMTADGKAIDPADQKIVDSNMKKIEIFFDKAEDKWGDIVFQ